jgi:hypothetical protein
MVLTEIEASSVFTGPRVRAALAAARAFAAGTGSREELEAAVRQVEDEAERARVEADQPVMTIFEARRTAAARDWYRAVRTAAEALARFLRPACDPAPAEAADFDPEWRSAAARGLAAAIDQDRSYHLLPVLADALEDAGCTDVRVLCHCRAGGRHGPGCWVVERVLGRA